MTFADDVTVLRPAGTDAYGNRSSDWSNPQEIAAKAFIPGRRDKGYFPVGTDLRKGDRLRLADGTVHEVDDPFTYRSPSRAVLMSCGLRRVEG